MKRAEVVAVSPALFSTKNGAAYCDTSEGLFRKMRSSDVKRRAAGLPLEGPEWVRLPRLGIRYTKQALDEWIARNAIAGGVMESKRRLPAPTADELAEAVQP